VPLASTFVLSTKKGKEVFVEPVREGRTYSFRIIVGTPTSTAKLGTRASGRGANFRCLVSDAPISAEYIRAEAQAGRLGQRMIGMVAEGSRRRLFLPPTAAMEQVARQAEPAWRPDVEFFKDALGFRVGNYGMSKWSDLFTNRQLLALGTFADLVLEAREVALIDAVASGQFPDDDRPLDEGGGGPQAYADAVATYLAFGVSRSSDYWSNLCTWRSDPKNLGVGHVFSRQTLSMVWDFA
jgi:putative DNA methylase